MMTEKTTMQRRKFIEDAAKHALPGLIASGTPFPTQRAVELARDLWDEVETAAGKSVGVAGAPSNSSWDVIDAKLKSVERELTICMRLLHEHGKLLHKVTSASSGER